MTRLPYADEAESVVRAAAAAARVRRMISGIDAENARVSVLDPKDGSPLDPNQLLHQLLAEINDVQVIAVCWKDASGFWQSDWSKAKPGELLEAATAFKLDAEVAWCETQEQAGDLDPDE